MGVPFNQSFHVSVTDPIELARHRKHLYTKHLERTSEVVGELAISRRQVVTRILKCKTLMSRAATEGWDADAAEEGSFPLGEWVNVAAYFKPDDGLQVRLKSLHSLFLNVHLFSHDLREFAVRSVLATFDPRVLREMSYKEPR